MSFKCVKGRAPGHLSAQFIRHCDVTNHRTLKCSTHLALEPPGIKEQFIIEQSPYGIPCQMKLNFANQLVIFNAALSLNS